MATSLRELIVSVSADTTKYQREMDRASRMGAQYFKSVKDGGATASRSWADQTAAARTHAGALEASAQAISRYAAVAASAFGVGQLAQLADSWTNIGNRLRLVTDSAAGFAAAQADVLRISQATRQPLDATAELYQRIAMNQEALELSGQDLARVVETISKTMVISGTSAAGAQAALVQLGQAFASGTLRGEELNSVLEQAPALAQAIAAGLGVPIGQLREMGKAGELTAQQVIGALQSQAAAVDTAFGSMDMTIGQAMTNLRTSFQEFVGKSAEVSGSSSAVAKALDLVARNMGTIATVGGAAALGALAGKMIQIGQAAAAAAAGMVQSQMAARVEALAIRDATLAGQLKAQADLRRAQAAMGAARGTAASATASRNYAAALLTERQATLAATQAQAAYLRATSAAGVAGRAALGLLGGPAGLAITVGMVAAGWLMFRDNTDAAASALDNWTGSADEAVAKFRELNAEQQRGAILNLEDTIGAGLRAVNEQVDELAANVGNLGAGGAVWDSFSTGLGRLQADLASGRITADQFSAGISALNDEVVAAVGGGAELERMLDLAESAMATAAREVDTGRERLARFNAENNNAAAQANATAGAIRGQAGAMVELGDEAKKAYEKIQNGVRTIPGQIERLGKSAGQVARLDVRDTFRTMAADGVDFSDRDNPQVRKAIEDAAQYIRLQEQLDAGQKRLAASTRALAAARKEAKVSEADEYMRELNEGYAQQVQSLERQVALLGSVGRTAAMAYDLANGSLSGLAETQKEYLLEMSAWLDEQEALQSVWDETAREHAKYTEGGKKKLSDMEAYADQAARNMQSALGDSLYEVLGGKFDGIADRFADMLKRMAAELLASQLWQAIGGALSGYGGEGGWGNFLRGVGGAMQGGTDGGRAGGGQVRPWSAYDITEHGDPEILRFGGRQVLLTGSKGGMVSPLTQAQGGGAAAGGGPQNVRIEIENRSGEIRAESAEASRQPDGTMLYRIVTSMVKKGFGQGEYDGDMSMFGVRRQGVSRG